MTGLVLALVGTALLASLDIASSDAAGIAGGLFGVLGYSFYLVLVRKWSRIYYLRPDVIALAAAFTIGLVFFVLLLIRDPESL